MGPWGHCTKCSSEQIALAVEERIARELLVLADSYIEFPGGDTTASWDIWTWSAELARRIRAGEFTQPLNTEPPF